MAMICVLLHFFFFKSLYRSSWRASRGNGAGVISTQSWRGEEKEGLLRTVVKSQLFLDNPPLPPLVFSSGHFRFNEVKLQGTNASRTIGMRGSISKLTLCSTGPGFRLRKLNVCLFLQKVLPWQYSCLSVRRSVLLLVRNYNTCRRYIQGIHF